MIDSRRVISYRVPRLRPPFVELLKVMKDVRPELQIIGAQFYVARQATNRFAWPRWDAMEIQVMGATGPDAPGVHPYPYIRRCGFGMTRFTALWALQRCPVLQPPAAIVFHGD